MATKAKTPRPRPAPKKKTEAAAEGAPGIRLQLVLSRAGVASRREAERLIEAGEVSVNGVVVRDLGSRAVVGRDHVKVSGRLVRPDVPLRYYAYHKPVGCVSTMRDPEGRFCVGDVARSLGGRGLFPVGRLDYASSGLILLTNDGPLAERLMHPGGQVEKRYAVKVKPRPGAGAIEELRRGVRLREGRTAPAYVREISHASGKAWLDVRIVEGRNQQVRRMFEAVGSRVEKLRRDAIGPIKLGELGVGEARGLEQSEVRALAEAVRRTSPPRARARRPQRC